MPEKRSSKCPVCRKPKSSEFAPFCSAGCKDREWLGEGYKVPGPPVSPDQLADHFSGDAGRDGES
ncbi:DNA gyrase inhibitor YacG [Parasphingorhabdus cellanae]|uniref:DNA gyrase inhibitor YacG n=1 Tax=Parasphingorhabdus cellanae TaxID=2806553 RepID=A0ABX7T5P0_9SPHN|nr:DNA gyrase inhibitor YacG [Parasphingorhabdus cellanae]QTD56914.1 DNA gyrase inhibitor YacG [Parasphingorhabdus cellanae]